MMIQILFFERGMKPMELLPLLMELPLMGTSGITMSVQYNIPGQ
jgi:hypothetical protein